MTKNSRVKTFALAVQGVARLYKPFRGVMLLSLSLVFFTELATLATPLLVGKVVDTDYLKATWLVLFIFSIEILSQFFNFLQFTVDLNFLETQSRSHLVGNTLRKLFGFSLGQVTHEHSGYVQSVISKGEESIASMVKTLFHELVPTVTKIIVTTVALAIMDPYVGMYAFFTSVSYTCLTLWLNLRIQEKVRQQQKLENRNQQWYSDVIRNLKLIISNSQEHKMLEEQQERWSVAGNLVRKIWTGYNTSVCCTREPANRLFFLIMFIHALSMYHQKLMSAGQFLTMMSWVLILFRHFDRIGTIQRRYITEYPAVFRYFELLSTPPMVVPPVDPVYPDMQNAAIVFDRVSFKYPGKDGDGGKGVIEDATFRLEPGKTYAFVGESGAGKSTLVSLLQRAYDPCKGNITVGGVDLRSIDMKVFRERIGHVEQDIKLWDGTIKYNILFGLNGKAAEVTEEELQEIARTARITQFYDRLGAKGLDTLIGENGIQLSGGQRQRIGIARALVKQPKILIFDEATNSLDNVNDREIQLAMRQALRGRTGIIIAHRLSTIRHVDHIIVLEKGRIVGQGVHEDLFKNCPAYSKLVLNDADTLVN